MAVNLEKTLRFPWISKCGVHSYGFFNGDMARQSISISRLCSLSMRE